MESAKISKKLESSLSQRMGMPDIKAMAAWALQDAGNRDMLWRLVRSDDRRTSVNALWIISHLKTKESEWLQSLQNDIVDMLLVESDTSKKRIMLQLLREQDFEPDDVRTDLIDFCFSKINSECEPYAVRAFCIYVAFKLCRNYPELLNELKEYLLMMSVRQLPPGLRCASRKTLAAVQEQLSEPCVR